MSPQVDRASSDFEKIARQTFLSQELDKASSELDIYRYDFASRVAMGNSVTENDMFDYLAHWANYSLAYRKAQDKPEQDFQILKDDCQKRVKSDIVKSHLLDRIRWAQDAIPAGHNSAMRLTQQAFLGLESPSTPINRVFDSLTADIANENLWLPFELSGLETCLTFFATEHQPQTHD